MKKKVFHSHARKEDGYIGFKQWYICCSVAGLHEVYTLWIEKPFHASLVCFFKLEMLRGQRWRVFYDVEESIAHVFCQCSVVHDLWIDLTNHFSKPFKCFVILLITIYMSVQFKRNWLLLSCKIFTHKPRFLWTKPLTNLFLREFFWKSGNWSISTVLWQPEEYPILLHPSTYK